MAKRILLITPPYHCRIVEAAGVWPPLGFVYIAGSLREAGHEVEVMDAMGLSLSMEQIKEKVADFKPDIVGTTAYTSSIDSALEVLKAVKEVETSIITVIGGVHAHFMYRDVLANNPQVDFVVRGEGEVTLPELVKAIEADSDLRKVDGVIFMRDGKLMKNPDRLFIPDLDSLTPAWDLLDWTKYTLFVSPGSRVGAIDSSRGCPFTCTFCSQCRFWKETYRERRPENFVNDIEYLRRTYGVDTFLLTDEYATRNRDRWEEILDLLIERDLGVHLLFETRVSDIIRDADIMWKYKEAGAWHIYVGVEATRQQTLNHFRKDIRCEESYQAIKLINDEGMISECSFILGMPDETSEKIKETVKLALHYNADFAHFLMVAPWPYAELYKEVESYVVEHDYSKYNFIHPILKPEQMTLDELKQAVVDCYRTFYMGKLTQIENIKDTVKRDYLIYTMKVMFESSFIKDFSHKLGKIPEEVQRFMEKYLGKPSTAL